MLADDLYDLLEQHPLLHVTVSQVHGLIVVTAKFATWGLVEDRSSAAPKCNGSLMTFICIGGIPHTATHGLLVSKCVNLGHGLLHDFASVLDFQWLRF